MCTRTILTIGITEISVPELLITKLTQRIMQDTAFTLFTRVTTSMLCSRRNQPPLSSGVPNTGCLMLLFSPLTIQLYSLSE